VVGVAGRRSRGRAGRPCVVFRSVRPAGARPTARGTSCLPPVARFLEPAYPKTGPPALKAVIKELRRAAAGCRKAPSLTSLPRSPANGADDGLDLALDERRRRLAPELPDRGRMQPGGSVLTSERESARRRRTHSSRALSLRSLHSSAALLQSPHLTKRSCG
jgi:hypothetical protein